MLGCSDALSTQLTAPISATEIWSTIRSLPRGKAPGPDGFTVEFFLDSWDIVGMDLVTAVQSFFINGFLPRGVNATALSLIPKSSSPSSFSDYRPISCCNLLYKIISKILANRLKCVLPEAIAANQTAFVRGRLLLENVLLATELVKDYHRSHISPLSALQLDIAKAFDTIEWDFITTTLHAMDFPPQFIHWIFTCISTASFSVSLSGALHGFFHGTRGIRQGCSLSPYLYVIAWNVLSMLLDQAAIQARIGYHPACKDPPITHLSFADDVLIFTDGSLASFQGVLQTMRSFADLSGLSCNMAKSLIFIVGTNRSSLETYANSQGMTVGTLPVRYLGLPLTTKTMSRADFEPLVDRIRSRLLSWTSKHLSYAGRLQLIQSVISGITNFWCATFRLPMACLDSIERLCSAFLWSGSPNSTKLAKVAWSSVCRPKDEGGLGIRSLREVSLVVALRLIWRLLSTSGSLWVAWIHRHFLRGSSFWDFSRHSRGSWVWAKLLRTRDVAASCFTIDIRDGCTTRFWTDPWLPIGCLLTSAGSDGPRTLGVPLNATVAEVSTAGHWSFRSRLNPTLQRLVDAITATPPPQPRSGRDIPLWRFRTDEFKPFFSSSSTWDLIRARATKVPWYHVIWFPQAIPKCAFIAWLAMQDRLSTGTRMRVWGQVQPCTLCGEPKESRDHLFFACPFTFTVWIEVCGDLLAGHASPDWHDTLAFLLTDGRPRLDTILLRLSFQLSIYHIWRERNARCHPTPTFHRSFAALIISSIGRMLRNRLSAIRCTSSPNLEGLRRRWFATRPAGPVIP